MTNHPHNNFFEKVFSMLDVTRDFLEQIPPKEFREALDLSELELLDKSHISESLRKTHSDLLFSAHLKTAIRVDIAILLEHKSNPESNPHVQINHYISSIHQQNLLNDEPLILVLPILFYHGKRRWKQKPFTESFPSVPEYFHRFIPKFEYLLIDLDDFIQNLKTGFLKNALLILKHSGDREYLIENVATLFKDIEFEKNSERRTILYETLINYLIMLTKIKPKEVKQLSAQLPSEPAEVFVSTADMLRMEGQAEGKIEGKIEGKTITKLIERINFSLIFLTQFPNFSPEKIAELASVKVNFVKKIKEGFESGNEKKARKTVYAFFKKFEPLDETFTKDLEEILEKFVSKFKN